jgi:hypothetical protein
MPKVSIPRQQIADGSLPSVCVICGEHARHRRFPKVRPPSSSWVLFSPIIGLLTFWVYILVTTRWSPSRPAGLTFCDRHRGYWPRRAWFIVGGFAVLIALIVAGMALGGPKQVHWLFGVALGWMVLYLPAFILVHLSATRPVERGRTKLVLAGASQQFASAVSQENDPAT